MLKSLTACRSDLVTDTFELWGQPICLTPQEKEVVTDEHIDYFILHNEQLKRECH